MEDPRSNYDTSTELSFQQSAKQPRFLDAGNTLGPADIDTSESNSNHVVYSQQNNNNNHGHHGDHNHLDNAHHHGHHAAISKRIDGETQRRKLNDKNECPV